MQNVEFENWVSEQTNIPLDTVQDLFPNLKRTHVSKGDFLLRQGEICQYSIYVETGLLKYYSIDEKGKVHVLQFAPQGWFLSDRESSFFNQPTPYFMDALEDSTVILLPINIFCEIGTRYPALEILNNRLLHNHIRHLQNRINLLLSATVEERYLSFIKMYPDLMLRVPHHLVASYLGVTPEGLSRVRKELAERHMKRQPK